MRLLLDTHLLLWSSVRPELLSRSAQTILVNQDNELVFGVASIWEIAIKHSRGHADFRIEPGAFRRGLVQAGLRELAVLGEHAIAVSGLPPIHKDPFDRLLISHAMVEGITLLTADAAIAQYPGPIQLV